MSLDGDLARLDVALQQASALLRRHSQGDRAFAMKSPGNPVTAADTEVDALLRALLPQGDDAWLSEESVDDDRRLAARRIWVVDPLDGTRSFLAHQPEWSVSIGLLVDGEPALGGIANPTLDIAVLGGPGIGLTVRGDLAKVRPHNGARLQVLCSRTEWRDGDWPGLLGADIGVTPIGSVAWKLALVAAGVADATWTRRPKHEWDVAAGAALVLAAGGTVFRPDGAPLVWNQMPPRFPGFAAAAAGAEDAVRALIRAASPPR
jgi:myo-inositol-1(or 4)-monophosphatase